MKAPEPSTTHDFLFDNCVIGLAYITDDGTFIRANPAYCKLVGYTETELLKLQAREITLPCDVEAWVEEREKVIAGEQEGYEIIKRYIRKDNRIVLVKVVVRGWVGEDGELMWFLTQASPPEMTTEAPCVVIEKRPGLGNLKDALIEALSDKRVMTAIIFGLVTVIALLLKLDIPGLVPGARP